MRKSFLSLFALIAILGGLWIISSEPTYQQVRARYQPSDSVILDRFGSVLYHYRANQEVRRLHWHTLDRISDHLKRVVVGVEDRRFFFHPGIDPIAFVSALKDYVSRSKVRGASTISMQLVSLLDLEFSGTRKPVRRTWLAKIKQTYRAFLLELDWSKDEILEAYLNLLYFRGELQGIGAASFGLFQKSPQELNKEESYILAALIRFPGSTPDQVASKACLLMRNHGSRDCGWVMTLANEKLSDGYRFNGRSQDNLLVAQQLKKTGLIKPGAVQTTIDGDLQTFVQQSLLTHVYSLKHQNMNEGAVIVLDNRNGDILAYVGNLGEKSTAMYVNGIEARRQAGSTLKPFVYGQSIENKILTSSTVLKDTPLRIPTPSGAYVPENYDKTFRGFVTVREALGSSLNIPAVRAIDLLGVGNFVQTMRHFGFTELKHPDFYGPSMALGSVDITLHELANAYRTLANHGLWSATRLSDNEKSVESRRALSPESAFIVSNMLSDRGARVATFGLENVLSTPFWTAVKTGTSKDMRDNWTVGYSDKYTVAVWAGNFDGQPMWNISGVQGAAPVWLDVMTYLHRESGSLAPTPPAGVVKAKVVYPHWKNKQVDEWFIKGTEPSHAAISFTDEYVSEITYPVDGMVLAIDPDAPASHSYTFFKISNPQPGSRLEINGKNLGSPGEQVKWKLRRGKFNLALVDKSGKPYRNVSFVVRGMH